jgi:tripartite-type tricarboxylate transporter receptor subunit TctC
MTKLNAAVTNISAAPEYRKQLAGRGFEPIVIRPYDFPEFLRAETSKWARVIKAAGISAD